MPLMQAAGKQKPERISSGVHIPVQNAAKQDLPETQCCRQGVGTLGWHPAWLGRAAFALLAVVLFAAPGDWRQFRGTNNNSVCPDGAAPVRFGPGENLAWKVALPGRGPSSPIVVGHQLVVTAASGPRQDRLHVLCFHADDGRLLWHRQLWATGSTIHNPFGGVANSTPASDGCRVFALFSSNDLACFDLEGNLLWLRGFGYERPRLRNDVGMASSPLVIGDVLVVQMESEGDALVVGINTVTGKTQWQIPREPGATWCSPTVLRTGTSPDGNILLLQTRGELAGYDPLTGRRLWRYEAECHTIASVTVDSNRIYLPAEGIHALEYEPATKSIRPLWYERRLRGNNSSPVVDGGCVYQIKSPAILMCGDAETGRLLWQLRLEGNVWATPVLAYDHLYVVSHEGLVQVVHVGKPGQRNNPAGAVQPGEVVATAQLDPNMLASPAVADGAIYFRSDQHLWKFASSTSR